MVEQEVRLIVIVVPCYNEAQRLQSDLFRSYANKYPAVRVVFVNDGSTDSTAEVLSALTNELDSFSLVNLQKNRGKAEAVRQGVLWAIENTDPDYVGYWDADLATPLAEIPRFVELMDERPDCDLVLGSRVKLLGCSIERRAVRHYSGRIFATLASLVLGIPVYDTQCGAKLFRVNSSFPSYFRDPFNARWAFDVEVIARVLSAQNGVDPQGSESVIMELPLIKWKDIPGSKLRPWDSLVAIKDLIRIYRRYSLQS